MIKPLLIEEPATGGYHDHPRTDVLRIVKAHHLRGRVLDIGCGSGVLGRRLLDEAIADEVVGVEMDVRAAHAAQSNITRVIAGDISDGRTLKGVEGTFDVVIAADVLEHLRDPAAVVAAARLLLRKGGALLVSVPNVRHFSVLGRLALQNDWRYAPEGICDTTHLRFFTSRSIQRLIEDAGLRTVATYGTVAGRSGRVSGRFAPVTSFAAVQVIVVAENPAPR